MNEEEIFCAQCIDANSRVETWIRNIERIPDNSFWLPTHKDKFYPDFVVKLKNGTFAAIEYKGEVYKTNDDSKEKNMLGKIWADKSHGLCKFLMALNAMISDVTFQRKLMNFLPNGKFRTKKQSASLTMWCFFQQLEK